MPSMIQSSILSMLSSHLLPYSEAAGETETPKYSGDSSESVFSSNFIIRHYLMSLIHGAGKIFIFLSALILLIVYSYV